MKVLVVEDDTALAEGLAKVLTAHQYQVELAPDGEAGLSLVEVFDYDLVLLDLHLPKLNGICFCQQLRSAGCDVPILLMTAEEERKSKIASLDAGADDYVTKPIDTDELLARIRALLRRGRVESSPILSWGPVSLDPSNYEVLCSGQPLALTKKEYGILELLLRNQHRTFSLDALVERLWSFEKMPSENAVRTHIKELRRKLKARGVVEMIETVYGAGYRLYSALAAMPAGRQSTDVIVTDDAPDDALSQQAMLASIWLKHRQKYFDLVARLDQVVSTSAVEGHEQATFVTTDKAVIERSRQAIHTLKGALGSFGFTALSKTAAQIEPLLAAAPRLSAAQCNQLSRLIASLRQSMTSLAETHSTSLLPVLPSDLSKNAVGTALPRWLIVDSDKTLIEDLTRQASAEGVETFVATTLAEAGEMMIQHTPNVVMIDPRCTETLEEGLAFLRLLTLQQPDLPVIVATVQDTLNDRIQVLRSSGGCLFLRKPVSAHHILEQVKQSIACQTCNDTKIVALDDDPQILDCLKQILSPRGFQLTLVSDPARFWQTVRQTTPDLLILDVEMPELSGIEICQVLRSDPQLRQIPVLFLSAHTDAKTMSQVFEVGADDYVSKPIVAPKLVARILNRLERSRLLRTAAER